MRRQVVRCLLLAVGISASAALGGCVVQTRGAVVVDAPPPPPRPVRIVARPGLVWVDGVWVSRGSRWVWRDGYWLRSRPGYVYVQGQWTRRGGRWHWVEPRWQTGRQVRGRVGGRVELRDHRSEKARERYRRDR